MILHYETFPTLLGPFSLAVDDAGAVVATAFGDVKALELRAGACRLQKDAASARAAREQILAYFAGERLEFSLPLAPKGTPFQQAVWAALRRIPPGETRSYGELAAQIGRPGAARAVGRANGTNPICLLIPCHRVIGADGSMTGFAFGETIKRRLLEHERTCNAGRSAA